MRTIGFAVAVLLAGATAACGSVATDSPPRATTSPPHPANSSSHVAERAPTFVGQWTLVRLTDRGHAVGLTGSESLSASFGAHEGGLSDGCNGWDLRYSANDRQLRIAFAATTAKACLAGSSARGVRDLPRGRGALLGLGRPAHLRRRPLRADLPADGR